ncbi:MAG: hypothetical protein ACRCW3_02435, partial [Metamycoplasmataceae bacterium]
SLDNKPPTATWNFNMAAIFQDGRHLSGAVKWYNGLFGDTSMKIGMSSLWWSLDNKPPTATWNFKMAAIFQDGHHLSGAIRLKVLMKSKSIFFILLAHITGLRMNS